MRMRTEAWRTVLPVFALTSSRLFAGWLLGTHLGTHLEPSVCWLVARNFWCLNGKRSCGTGGRSLVSVKSADASVLIPLEDRVCHSADTVSVFTYPSSGKSRSTVSEPCTQQGPHSAQSVDIYRKWKAKYVDCLVTTAQGLQHGGVEWRFVQQEGSTVTLLCGLTLELHAIWTEATWQRCTYRPFSPLAWKMYIFYKLRFWLAFAKSEIPNLFLHS
jgi:hypothetical protein